MRNRLVVPTLMLLAAAPAMLAAQTDIARPGIIAGAEFRTVSFGAGIGIKTLSEFAVPLGFSMPVSQRFSFDVGTYFVRAERKDEAGASATVSGLTDVVLRSAFQIKPDVAVFTLAVNVPTGKHTLDPVDQSAVASAVATDLIPFPVSNFGSGFSVTSGLALAAPAGPWALGLAGSYRFNGSYQPFTTPTTTLKPGGEVRFRLGADRIVGQGRVSLGVTYSTFSNDEFGSSARKPGTRLIPQASWSLPLGNNSVAVYAWDVFRNVDDSVGPNENTIALGAIFAVPMGRNNLRPLLEYRQTWRGGQANGTLFGVGARYAIAASSRLSLTPGVRVDFGSIPNAGSSASIFGLSASLTVRGSL